MSVPLASLTTLRVGGPATELREPSTRAELIDTVRAVWAGGDDWLLLGGGSNVVLADEGFDGTVIRIATTGISETVDDTGVVLRVEAGEPWDGVAALAAQRGFGGLESLSGIPGSAGAAPIQNIGAYGGQLSDHLVAVDFLEYSSGDVLRLTADELELGYRTSALKRGRHGVVLGIELALPADGFSDPIRYAQLADALAVTAGTRLAVPEVRRAVLGLRSGKGMLLDPADPDSVSVGSFFTNPIVSESFARALPADAPRWPTSDDEPARILEIGAAVPPPVTAPRQVKLSAAWLIEHAGITRGFRLPGSGAAISSKHTLAIINTGSATALDVVQLAGYLQTRVLSEFGILLQPEPILVGVEL